MKQNLKIVPEVQIEFEGDKKDQPVIWVTAAKVVTDRMWEILHNLDLFVKSRAFEMDRPDNVSTQFWFSPNPGYSQEEVLSLVVSGTYIAQVYENDLDAFWQIGWFKHFSDIGKQLNLSKLGAKFVTDEETFKTVLNAFLSEKVKAITKNTFENVARTGPGNIQFTLSRVEAAKKELERALLIEAKIYKMLQQDKTLIKTSINVHTGKLEVDHNTFAELIARASAIRAQAKMNYLRFNQKTTSGNYLELYRDWASLMESFKNNELVLQNLSNGFDEDYGADLLKKIKALIPSVSTK